MAMDDKKRFSLFGFFKKILPSTREEVPEDAQSITAPDDGDMFPNPRDQYQSDAFGAMGYANYIQQVERTKEEKLCLYRQMERFPHIDDALDEVLSEAVNENDKGEILELLFKRSFNKNQRKNLEKEWQWMVDNAWKIDQNYYIWIREYMVTGEFALENIIEDVIPARKRKKGILKTKFHQSENYIVEYDLEGNVDRFVIKSPFKKDERVLASGKNQMSYINTGKFDLYTTHSRNPDAGRHPQKSTSSPERTKIVLSMLEKVKKVYRQLDALEDSLVIYRLGRAPERLVFNVDVGGLPKNKAEEYMQKLINKYRKKKIYNSKDGVVNQAQNIKNIVEDFWFAKSGEKGTEVTSLPAGQNLGEITDVLYFLNKLYKAFKIPATRIPVGEGEKGATAFTNGQVGSVTRDEIKFEQFVRRNVNRFLLALKDSFIVHLKLKGLWDQYKMNHSDIEIFSVPSMYFIAHKEAEKVEVKFSVFNQYSGFVGELFSKEFVLMDILGWTKEQFDKNKKQLKKEQEEEEGFEDGGDEDEELGGSPGEEPDAEGPEEEPEEEQIIKE